VFIALSPLTPAQTSESRVAGPCRRQPTTAPSRRGCRINRSANRCVNQSRDNRYQPVEVEPWPWDEVTNEGRNQLLRPTVVRATVCQAFTRQPQAHAIARAGGCRLSQARVAMAPSRAPRLLVLVQLSSKRARQAVQQDCSSAKKQECSPALLVVVQSGHVRPAGGALASRRKRWPAHALTSARPVRRIIGWERGCFRFEGRVGLVTGGNGGLGLVFAVEAPVRGHGGGCHRS
jgi:hypothetical protein